MPQPIDPQSELGRVATAERVQQMMERAAQLSQMRQLDDATADTIKRQEQVLEAEQKKERVEQENRRKNPFMQIRRRKGKDGDEEQQRGAAGYNARQRPEANDDPEDHALDVTL